MPVRYQSVGPLITHRYASLLTSYAGVRAFTRLVLSAIAVDSISPPCVCRSGGDVYISKDAYYIPMERHRKVI